ncbi:hypothetical protein KIN20_010166 [Parelaphostrongylus tenuis]|uniref:Uncharacterized protein n=1 Tax=Parelaphostrongylus tenuis TaxID=148309 RepID=A0AAD5MTP6_PARTN|nr:hypothetical protein KIN20_010166 [Parelaphostrongylus tenuis]
MDGTTGKLDTETRTVCVKYVRGRGGKAVRWMLTMNEQVSLRLQEQPKQNASV